MNTDAVGELPAGLRVFDVGIKRDGPDGDPTFFLLCEDGNAYEFEPDVTPLFLHRSAQ